MYENMILPFIKDGVCGCIYTQLSDVEDEINGLYTYDREICKVEKEKLLEIKDEIHKNRSDLDMVYGLVCVILGILIIDNPYAIASVIPFILGLIIIILVLNNFFLFLLNVRIVRLYPLHHCFVLLLL